MLQSLDVISINLWQILISLANLLLLFIIIKKFLFKPVKRILLKRENELEAQYMAAQQAEKAADESKRSWEEKLQSATEEAETILSDAAENAKFRGEKIVTEAQKQADGILRQAETEAALAYQKAEYAIKREIIEVSGALTEKMLEREMNTKDHRNLIDSFIRKIGEDHDGNQ